MKKTGIGICVTQIDRELLTGKVIGLTDACLFPSELSKQKKNFEILPLENHQDEIYAEILRLIEGSLNDVLIALSLALNKIHNVNLKTEFWQIVVGFWLRQFLENLFYRYILLRGAHELVPHGVLSSVSTKSGWVATDTDEFSMALFTDEFNQLFYSQINSVCLFFEKKSITVDFSQFQRKVLRKEKYKKLRFFVSLINTAFCYFNRTIISRSYFQPGPLFRLSFGLKTIPLVSAPRLLPAWGVDLKKRRNLRANIKKYLTKTDLDHVVIDLIVDTLPRNLPGIFLEKFETLSRWSTALRPKFASSFLTGNSFAADEIFKYWMGLAAQNPKSNIIFFQHGGNYGHSKYYSDEMHELLVSTKYFSGGWQSKNSPSTVPLGLTSLAGLKICQSPETFHHNSKIIYVLNTLPRFFYTLFSAPQSSNFKHFLKEQNLFLRSLEGSNRLQISLRAQGYDYGWQDLKNILKGVEDVKMNNPNEPLLSQMGSCRAMVFSYHSTALLQSMAGNVPTLCFWNSFHWQWRESSNIQLDAMRRVGLYHDTSGAADFLNHHMHGKRLEEWWVSDDVQEVRGDYCLNYARGAISVDEWVKNISREMQST